MTIAGCERRCLSEFVIERSCGPGEVDSKVFDAFGKRIYSSVKSYRRIGPEWRPRKLQPRGTKGR
jgi:hypothetical protein